MVVKKIFALNDFKDRYNANNETAFDLTDTLNKTAIWRPAHRRKKVENPYSLNTHTTALVFQ